MRIFTPPHQILISKNMSIFLAGTIDMGNSEDWQQKIAKFFALSNVDVDIYNPRRLKWNSELKQSSETPEFYQQVNWELDAMKKADLIIMNFLPDSQSPITLLELGLFASSGKLLVACPDKFWRSGNVQIVCNNYNIPLYKDLESLLRENSDLFKIKN